MKPSVFRSRVYGFYASHRRELPWRKTKDPYRILVSEIMLQQTQVVRVVDRYGSFMKKFPTIASVAGARLRSVLDAWSGLGYNRRALSLKKLALIIMDEHGGRIPDSVELLKKLPGVGDATAHAVCAFAFNKPVVFLETNIRTVFIHHFFKGKEAVKDSEILPLVEKTLDTRNPREWYYALMDYGVSLKRLHGNPSRRSAAYKRQRPFRGSDRQVRGAIIRLLVSQSRIPEETLFAQLPFARTKVKEMVARLAAEGFVERKHGSIMIALRT